jgi:hypothetical protein
MVALGSGLTISVEPSVLSDLRSASSTEERLAILGIASSCGAVALTDEDGAAIRAECVKPFGEGN